MKEAGGGSGVQESEAPTSGIDVAPTQPRSREDHFKPGSSKASDALVGTLSEDAARRIPNKLLLTYRVVQRTIGPLSRLLFRVERYGTHHIPKRGGLVMASNHVSWFDPIVVVFSMQRPVSALGKSFLFRGRFRTWFFEYLAGQIRVDRERGGNLAAIEASIAAAARGRCIGVWPEGGRSPTRHLTRGKTGVARIALATGAPILPAAVVGTFDLKPKHGERIAWGTRVKVIFGEPMSFPDFVGQQEDRVVTRKVTDEIMHGVARLMGPDEDARYHDLLTQDVPPGELPLDKRESA